MCEHQNQTTEAFDKLINTLREASDVYLGPDRGLTQQMALKALQNQSRKDQMVKKLLVQREYLTNNIQQLKMVDKVFPSDANFVLVRFKNSQVIFDQLTQSGIIVRDRSNALHCESCLRFTVGTKSENKKLIEKLNNLDK